MANSICENPRLRRNSRNGVIVVLHDAIRGHQGQRGAADPRHSWPRITPMWRALSVIADLKDRGIAPQMTEGRFSAQDWQAPTRSRPRAELRRFSGTNERSSQVLARTRNTGHFFRQTFA
jgi:hypothetical protein